MYLLFSWSYICFLFLFCRSKHSNPLKTREICILTHVTAFVSPEYYAYFLELQLSFWQFSFSYYSLIWHLKYQIKYDRKLLFVIQAEVSNFSDEVYCGILVDCWCSFFFIIFIIFIRYILTGWKKIEITAEQGLDMFRILCQNSI